MSKPRVYIAGPECFLEDSEAVSRRYLELAESYGFEGLSPALSKEGEPIDFSNPDRQFIAREICRKNLLLIDSADLIIANTNDFRGFEPDSGTAFEMGYAYGKNKKMYCYMSDTRPCDERYTAEKFKSEDGRDVDDEGRWFETDCLNLMLYCPTKITEGTFEDALKVAAEDFGTGGSK